MSRQASKMLIEAGVIPKNTLQQLANWCLLPEDCTESYGSHKIQLDIADSESVERFVKDLGEALVKDMAELRETDLDRSGSYRKAHAEFEDHSWDCSACDVFVDQLGRVVTPYGEPWGMLEILRFDGEDEIRRVVRKEVRYEGDTPAALVVYLEAKGTGNASLD